MTDATAQVKEMIEAALNCMTVVADAQINDESAEALYMIADALAEEFGIERIQEEVTDGVDQDGNPVTVIREVGHSPKFKLSDYWREQDDEEQE